MQLEELSNETNHKTMIFQLTNERNYIHAAMNHIAV